MEMLDDAGVPVGTNRYIKTSKVDPYALATLQASQGRGRVPSDPVDVARALPFCVRRVRIQQIASVHNNSFLTTGLP